MAFRLRIEDDFTPEGIERMALEIDKARVAVAALASGASPPVRQDAQADAGPGKDQGAEGPDPGRDAVADALAAAEREAEERKALSHLEFIRSLRMTKYWHLLSAAYRLQSKPKGYFSIKELASAAGYRTGTAYGYKDDIGLKAQRHGINRTFYRTMANCWRMTPALYEAMRRDAAAREAKARDSSARERKAVAG